MLRHLSGPTVKALLLGLFCCLGAHAKQAEAKKPKAELLALRTVHPQSQSLLAGLKAGTGKVPPGYKVFQIRVIDYETGKKIGQEPILLSLKTIVTEKHVQLARPDQGIGTLSVTLTEGGGERLNTATKKMKLGVDRMAVVLEGECIIAPTVQAVLSRRFIINGLDGKAEVDRLTKALNNKRQK